LFFLFAYAHTIFCSPTLTLSFARLRSRVIELHPPISLNTNPSPLAGEEEKSWGCASKPLDFSGEGVIAVPFCTPLLQNLRLSKAKPKILLSPPQGGRD